ncbi:hypothetical protein FB107DRAFT_247942 [Schizophyllum commune]
MGYIQTSLFDYGGLRSKSQGKGSNLAAEAATESECESACDDASALLEHAKSIASFELYRRRLLLSPEEVLTAQELASSLVAHIERINSLKKRIATSGEHSSRHNERLTACRKGLLRQLVLHRSLDSLIWRLPPELLSCIFLQYKALHDDQPSCDSHYMVRLAQVCSVWRETARHTPSLWTRYTSVRSSGLPMSFNADLLLLSRDAPLEICHDFDTGHDGPLLRLLEQIQPHASHWGSITLGCAIRHFTQIPVLTLPALREASLQLYDDWQMATAFRHVLDFLTNAPGLVHLDISSNIEFYGGDSEFLTFVMPAFRHLTHLSVKLPNARLSKEQVVLALGPCRPSLVSLALHTDLFVPRIPSIHAGRVVPFPALRTLDLSQSAVKILENILAPSLDELSLRCSTEIRLTSLTCFAARPGNALASLRKATLSCWDQDIALECLEKMDSLRELYLGGELSPARNSVFARALSQRMTCFGACVSAGSSEAEHGGAGHGHAAAGIIEPCGACALLGDAAAAAPLLPSLQVFKVDRQDLKHLDSWYPMIHSRQVARVCGGRVIPKLEVVEA